MGKLFFALSRVKVTLPLTGVTMTSSKVTLVSKEVIKW